VIHLVPRASYHVEVHRVGFHANDAYSAYLELGGPKDLTPTQIAHLMDITRDVPETDHRLRAGPDGTVAITLPMKSNDVVLVEIAPE
jgi:xylan 1,4-beta-xylosidase